MRPRPPMIAAILTEQAVAVQLVELVESRETDRSSIRGRSMWRASCTTSHGSLPASCSGSATGAAPSVLGSAGRDVSVSSAARRPRRRRESPSRLRIVRRRFSRGSTTSSIPWSSRNSAVWKPAGSFWWIVCSITDGSGEADVRARLGDQDVAERGVGRADAAVGWVGEQRDEQHAFLVQARDGLARLRHLHQRHAALLHPGAAGGRDHRQRAAALQSQLGGAGDRLADGAAHAAADEPEVDRRDRDRQFLDRAGAVERARLASRSCAGRHESARSRAWSRRTRARRAARDRRPVPRSCPASSS